MWRAAIRWLPGVCVCVWGGGAQQGGMYGVALKGKTGQSQQKGLGDEGTLLHLVQHFPHPVHT